MSDHTPGCSKCIQTSQLIGELKTDIVRLVRTIDSRPGTSQAKGCRSQIIQKREQLSTLRARQRECCGESGR